jgi:Mn-dependent DtxR family transcriptional regulator
MGIRKIEDEIDLKEAMKKKAAELKIKEITARASVEKLTREHLRDLAKRHGVILALTPELRAEVKELQKIYNIPSSKIITEQIREHDVLKKFSKVDIKKLGMLAYQRVLMQKEETGGIVPLSEVFELINTGILKGNVDIKDVLKSMKFLQKENVIDDVKIIEESGAIMIHFFPVQFTTDQSKVVELAKEKSEEKGFVSVEDVCSAFKWSQERALKVLRSLENSGVAKFTESLLKGKQWFFPSI